ncbi:MAG: riboflavin synthase [Sphingomonadales bacterium]|nr:riboflavin synthase [Sphingomonadales bacterium]
MFTGIITDKGTVTKLERDNGLRIEVKTAYDTADIAMGASVACSGVCLTVVAKTANTLSFDVSEETLDKTSLNTWAVGDSVNMERPLKVGDELGGHIVSGHVDCVVSVLGLVDDEASKRFTISMPENISQFIAQKGSVTLDGVSLTVNDVRDGEFDVNIVPHTQVVTSFGEKKLGDKFNLEIDVLARYLFRMGKTISN